VIGGSPAYLARMASTNSEINSLLARVKELEEVVIQHQTQFMEFEQASIDFLLVLCGALVFFIQLGFMLYEAGSVRLKNTKNIFIKNTLDCCIGAIGYWAMGYGLAFGTQSVDDEGNGFCGNSWFFYSYGPGTKDYAHFFYNFTFVAAATTILSGALAERVTMHSYLSYSLMLSSFVFPIVSHWAWSSTGWLSPFRAGPKLFGVGAVDFAGSGVVHLTGGVAAFTGIFWIGPRLGRFKVALVNPFKPHSANLQVLGTFIQWVGWYGFNCGSILTFGFSGFGNAAGRIAITTTLAGAASGIVSLFYTYYYTGRYDIVMLLNGTVAGLVGITGGCATVTPWSSLIIGIVSAIIFQRAQVLTMKMKLDDAVDAIAVHFWCGIWGVLSVGIFSRSDEMMEVYGTDEAGLIYGGGKIFCANCVLVLSVIIWVGGWMCLFFGVFSHFDLFRVSKQAEIDGLDAYYHGGSAFIISQDDDPSSAAVAEHMASISTLNPISSSGVEMTTVFNSNKETSFENEWKGATKHDTSFDTNDPLGMHTINQDAIPPPAGCMEAPLNVVAFAPTVEDDLTENTNIDETTKVTKNKGTGLA
jgi:ammonium transporter, Amt family